MKLTFVLLTSAIFLSACKQQESAPPAPAEPAAVESAAVELAEPSAVPPPTGPVTPSFDCAKAESEAETMVCADYGLAALDNRLAEVYASELTKPGVSKDLSATQRGWVKGRDECWKADDKKLCVEEEYRTRIAELQINSPGAMAATAMEFKCDDNSKPFTMAYYNNLDDKPAIITFGNDQAIIFPQPAASGAKYGRNGISFWEHQGKATLDFFGIQLKCVPVLSSSNF